MQELFKNQLSKQNPPLAPSILDHSSNNISKFQSTPVLIEFKAQNFITTSKHLELY